MKSPVVLFLLTLVLFCGSSAAQNRSTRKFDLRVDATGGATRTRFASGRNQSDESTIEAIEQQVFGMINAERVKNGLTELNWNDNLAAVARVHSQDMAHEKFFSHRGSDGSMVDERADRLGLGTWRSIGENIAYMRGFDDPASLAVEKWLASPAHRKNLLGPAWQQSAVGAAMTADGTYYLTEVFLLR